MNQKWTMKTLPLVFFVMTIVLGITDLGFCIFGGVNSSLSAFIVGNSFAAKFPPLSIFIFMMGCIAGHLFFGMEPIAALRALYKRARGVQ